MSIEIMNTKKVYLLHHVHDLHDGEQDVKFIGAYSTEKDPNSAADRARILPGFSEYPQGFIVEGYPIGKDHWTEGFLPICQIKRVNNSIHGWSEALRTMMLQRSKYSYP